MKIFRLFFLFPSSSLPPISLRVPRSYDGVDIGDISLTDYIAIDNKAKILIPHSAARWQVGFLLLVIRERDIYKRYY